MTFSIEVKKRTGDPQNTRDLGLIPAVLYGKGEEPVSVAIDSSVFLKLYQEAGESNLIDLNIEGGKEKSKVLIQEIQRDPVKGNIIHIDLMKIDMNKEMHATLPIEFVGEAPAVKELGGTLIKGLQELNIKCLPSNLVGSISLDISILKTFDDTVRVGDINFPEGIVSTNSPETVVAKVAAPLSEEQLKAMEETVAKDVSEVEVEGVKKEEGEEEKTEESKAEETQEKKD
jgi:large subunit ribosomal protein L25